MRYLLSAVALAFGIAAGSGMAAAKEGEEMWSTAISRHATEDKAIIFRFVSSPLAPAVRTSLPSRVVLVWRYHQDGNKGMPSQEERIRMDEMEDLLVPLERDHVAKLAIVSTGNDLREWTYYAASEAAFLAALNKALAGRPTYPIEIHIGDDPSWSTWRDLVAGIKPK